MQNSKRLCAPILRRFLTQRITFNRTFLTLSASNFTSRHLKLTTNLLPRQRTPLSCFYHDDIHSDGEDDVDAIYQDQPKPVKHILYPSHDDALLPLLNACASIQEVFNFFRKYDKIIQPMHLAQSVLVLWDLQRIFQHVTELTSLDKVEKIMKEYSNQLITRHEFQILLGLIEQHVNAFSADELSCVYMYLSRIGVKHDEKMMKHVFSKLMEEIPKSPELRTLGRFMISVNYTKNKEAYEVCKQLLPIVLEALEVCTKLEDLKQISICLNVLNQEITPEMLSVYQHKVKEMLNTKLLNSEDTEVLLKVILFLNYPQWRHTHAELLSECMLLIKNKISQFSLNEIIILNDVFLKTQEPARILFELQRCSAKLMRELEENDSTAYHKRLRLANSLIQLSAPSQRPGSEVIIKKYFQYPLNGKCLLELLKAIQYVKIMDPLFCKAFWDKILTELEHDDEFKNNYLLKVCYLYMTYNQNLPYRHPKLEKRLNQWIEGLIETSCLVQDQKRFIMAAAFVIAYGTDVSIMNYMANMFRDHWEKFGALNCLTMARGLNIGWHLTKNVYLKERYYDSFCETHDRIILGILEDSTHPLDVNITNILMKCYMYRNKLDHPIVSRVLLTYKEDTYLSSKQIKNLTMCLLMSSALLPGIIERMVDYVCKCKENILAFNAEKVAFLCYYLGYIPTKSELLSKILIDLILRDQEKINGLSYLQSCLSLCFFNSMTGPLIKQIFNVRFMEKLDLELKNCYAKDVYPNRVHRRLMELNRTVCIDYPELNIPWFHQKYVQQSRHDLSHTVFFTNVENYLNKIFYDCDIELNALTPYGYNVDFAIKYKDDDNQTIKLGILLTKSKQYTNVNTQLKGAMQTKIRHVEMLGYKVKVVSFSDWSALVYAEDKIAYIRKLLNLPSRYPKFYYQINR